MRIHAAFLTLCCSLLLASTAYARPSDSLGTCETRKLLGKKVTHSGDSCEKSTDPCYKKPCINILDQIASRKSLSMFLGFIRRAGFSADFRTLSNYTILAPTNQGIKTTLSKLGMKSGKLTKNQIQDIVLYHMIPDMKLAQSDIFAYAAADPPTEVLTYLGDKTVYFATSDDCPDVYTVVGELNEAAFGQYNIPACNDINLHILNGFLIPQLPAPVYEKCIPPPRPVPVPSPAPVPSPVDLTCEDIIAFIAENYPSLAEILTYVPDFAAALVTQPGQAYTVFAPTDDAFSAFEASLPMDKAAFYTANGVAILRQHITIQDAFSPLALQELATVGAKFEAADGSLLTSRLDTNDNFVYIATDAGVEAYVFIDGTLVCESYIYPIDTVLFSA